MYLILHLGVTIVKLTYTKISLCRAEVVIVACFHIQHAQKPTQGGKGEVKRYNHSHCSASLWIFISRSLKITQIDINKY